MMRNALVSAVRPRPDTAPRGRLGRYALWQLKDFALQRGAAMLAIALVLAYPVISTAHAPQVTWDDAGRIIGTMPRDPVMAATRSLFGIVLPVIILGTLLAVRGIVSDDRQHGYHRFLFAKPVSITRYYAQSYAVQLAGYLAVVGLLILLFALFLRPVPAMPGLFAAAALFFVLVGGAGFLLSTVVRPDWLWLLLTVGSASIVGGVYDRGERWLAPLVAVLPPATQLSHVMSAAISPQVALRPGALLWVLGYGVACVVAGLLVLRRRPLPA